MEKIIEIPEGYKARIEGNKVILEPKENEDEQSRKWILEYLYDGLRKSDEQFKDQFKSAIAWFEKQGEKQKLDGTFVNVDDVREDFVNEVYRILDSDPNNDRANQIIDAFDSLPTLESVEQKIKAKQVLDLEKGKWYVCDTPRYSDFIVGKVYYCPKNEMLQPNEGEMARYVAKHCFHPWTIEDAKDGDVLVASDGSILLFKCVVDAACKHYIALTTDNVVKINEGLEHYWETSRAVHPATKEQRDLLFQKMKEAGYEWDAEKRELRKIEQKHTPKHRVGDTIYYNSFGELKSMIVANVVTDSTDNPMYEDKEGNAVFEKDIIEQKPTWSEEDERMVGRPRGIIERYAFSQSAVDVNGELCEREFIEPDEWLKSLKERVQPQPKSDWNNNDEISFNRLMAICADEKNRISPIFSEKEIKDLMDWLESIKKRVQPQWKPSDEHIKALEHVLLSYIGAWQPEIQSLLNDLKKLKG